ncbi:MAG: hypothetical protein QOG43_2298 [Actinomycetota bacterium]|jgi:hypothetical protein|nr:hypothetical protein [Actinomycetota bacterium]
MPNNEWGDFQTPAELAALAVSALPGRRWGRVLEPTCGIGRFLEAADCLGADVERLGIEVQPGYAEQANAKGFNVLARNIFDLNLEKDLKWNSSGPLLVLGNPPWITSAQLGGLGSINLPAKSNIRNLKGFDAITGASNFDIAEFIFLKLMLELQAERPTISLLVKTHVARNVLSFAAQFGLPYSRFTMRAIDAKAWFGANVDACLFTLEHSTSPEYVCDIYPHIDSQEPSRTIGVVDGRIVADMARYKRTSFVDGSSPLVWRSGVKHDASAVMEITHETRSQFAIEDEYVFPLLKCTDLFRGRLEPTRLMVVPQLRFGEDTAHLQLDAPMLWAYLESHGNILDTRGSSIYRHQPRFAVFGLGEYTFAPYKIAISGLHKEIRFVVLGRAEGKPVVVDDACYSLSFEDGIEASMCFALLTSEAATDLLESLVFWDAKRPISKKLLQRVDLLAIARKADVAQLEPPADDAARQLGVDPPPSWRTVLDDLVQDWELPAPKRRQAADNTVEARLF